MERYAKRLRRLEAQHAQSPDSVCQIQVPVSLEDIVEELARLGFEPLYDEHGRVIVGGETPYYCAILQAITNLRGRLWGQPEIEPYEYEDDPSARLRLR